MTDTRIAAALERALELGEVGVQVAAYLHDELIVDGYIGVADTDSGRPVDAATLFPVFSSSKALIATAVHVQAERGLLDVDAPIANYWPEYAANGKGNITLRHVLTHRAGVVEMPADLTLDGLQDWDAIVAYLATVTPTNPPGARSQYHALSFGYILGEVVRRTDPKERLFGDFLRDEILEPIGVDDLWVGLPPSEEPRVATLTWGAAPPEVPQVAPSPLRLLSMPAAISPAPDTWNDYRIHQAIIPAGSGIMTARAGAHFFALLANRGEFNGVRLLSPERLLELTTPRDNPLEVDEGIGMATSVGIGGYWLGGESPPADPVVGTDPHILAHGGAGGTIGWADLDTGLSCMITHNRMFGGLPIDQHPFVEIGRAVRAVAAEHA